MSSRGKVRSNINDLGRCTVSTSKSWSASHIAVNDSRGKGIKNFTRATARHQAKLIHCGKKVVSTATRT